MEEVLTRARGTGAAVIVMLAGLAGTAGAALPAAAAASTFGSVHGSAEQVYLTGARPGVVLMLVDRRGRKVQSRRVDRLGALLFRGVAPGRAYRVRAAAGGRASAAVTVFSNR